MKTSFALGELQKWIDSTRAEVVVGPNAKVPERTWTTAQINEAWARSAHNVLSMLEEFLRKA